MGRVNNTIDKFGRHRVRDNVLCGCLVKSSGIRLNPNGQFDFEGKSLTKIAKPINGDDATTKEYVLMELQELAIEIGSALNEVVVPQFRDMIIELEKRIDHISKQVSIMHPNKIEKYDSLHPIQPIITPKFIIRRMRKHKKN